MQDIKVFIPAVKGRVKTTARGFWLDNGKVYYDYVIPQEVSVESIPEAVEALRVKHNQIAMFYMEDGRAFIQSADYRIDALPCRKYVMVCGARALRAYVKKFLKDFNGCTVYNHGRAIYEIESFTK